MVPDQVSSSILSLTAAPGRQRATRCGSMRNSQTEAGGALTTKVLAISNATRASRQRELDASLRFFQHGAGALEIGGHVEIAERCRRPLQLERFSAVPLDHALATRFAIESAKLGEERAAIKD